MCGIFGLLKSDHSTVELSDTFRMGMNALSHRGPDDEGYYTDQQILLGHRRLSIIDLHSGQQPIFNEDRTKCIIFNGEIYNYRELRQELLSRNHIFLTNSDTEVIIHAFEEYGDSCVNRLRGMFAFAIWDSKERRLFIARDRLGIKPLFYARTNNAFYFASEMKAILQLSDFPRHMDQDALAAYFTLSYIPAPLTIFKDIRKLSPGHTLSLKDNHTAINQYWDLKFQPDHGKDERYFCRRILELLEESIRYRLISDVSLGAFLSGGIDSGAVVAMMSRLSSEPVNTFCIGFGGEVGGHLDERKYAQEIATRFRTRHGEYEVKPSVREILGEIIQSFDEPFGDSSTIPSYHVSRITRKQVKVALSGLGGDELFGGYERYLGFSLSQTYNLLPLFLRENVIRRLLEAVPERADGHYTVSHLKRFVRSAPLSDASRYFSFSSMIREEVRRNLFVDYDGFASSFDNCHDLFVSYFNRCESKDPMDRVYYCDLKTYVPEDILACTDRMSMCHSLEVRVPFLDHHLVEFCATIPSEFKIKLLQKKYILKKALTSILPKSILKHRKQGFIGPMTRWLRTDLKDYAQNALKPQRLAEHGLFNPRAVKTILDEHFARKEINDKLIWSLLVFQEWYERYIGKQA